MRIWVLTFWILFSVASFGQLDESLIKRINQNVPDCNDVAINSQRIISQFYLGGDLDSAEAVLEYWEENCQPTDEMIFGRMLFDIAGDRFQADEYQNLLDILLAYKSIQDYIEIYNTIGVSAHPSRATMLKANSEFYSFTKSYAKRLLEGGEKREKMDSDILKFFSGNYETITNGLKQNEYDGRVQRDYNQLISDLVYNDYYFFTLYGGMWSPTGNLSKLGNKPEFGFSFGGFDGRYGAELILGFRFVDSPVDYSIREEDSIYSDNHFSSVTIGVQGYYSFLKTLRHDLSFTTGIAYDEITLVPTDEEKDIENVSTGSLNVNLGLQYRYYFDFKDYFGIDVRYSVLDFSNDINNELRGHAVSLRLIYGFTSSDRKRQQLRRLGY